MKCYIYLVSFLGICSCFPDYFDLGQDNWNHDDIDTHAESPCPQSDINCIRRYFAQHSHCRVAHGSVPDPLILDGVTMPFALPNMTTIMSTIKIRGVNGRVTVFTINRKTKNLVIAAEMNNLTVYDPHLIYKYHRNGKESIALSDNFIIRYASVTFTATIPNIDNLEVSNSEVFTYIADSQPLYAIGPGLFKSTDKDVIASYSKLFSNMHEVSKEAMAFLGPMLMWNYIQYNICDFGLKMSNQNQRTNTHTITSFIPEGVGRSATSAINFHQRTYGDQHRRHQ